jgi:hypothetical protein
VLPTGDLGREYVWGDEFALPVRPSDRQESGVELAIPDHRKPWDPSLRSVAHHRRDGPPAVADLYSTAAAADLAGQSHRSPDVAGPYRSHKDLNRTHRSRESPIQMLEQDPQEALEGPRDGAMHEGRDRLRPIRVDIRAAKTSGQLKIQLQGAGLPLTAQRVGHQQIDLWGIERALARHHFVAVAAGEAVKRHSQHALRPVPHLIVAELLGGAVPNLSRKVRPNRPYSSLASEKTVCNSSTTSDSGRKTCASSCRNSWTRRMPFRTPDSSLRCRMSSQ